LEHDTVLEITGHVTLEIEQVLYGQRRNVSPTLGSGSATLESEIAGSAVAQCSRSCRFQRQELYLSCVHCIITPQNPIGGSSMWRQRKMSRRLRMLSPNSNIHLRNVSFEIFNIDVPVVL
jgi:hypothetical protein